MPLDQLVSVKVVRSELRSWGNWWLRHEYGDGYAKRNACDKLQDPMVFGGGWNGEVEIQVPGDIAYIGRRIDELSPAAKRAIRAQYLCKGKWALCEFKNRASFVFWLRKAELALLKSPDHI